MLNRAPRLMAPRIVLALLCLVTALTEAADSVRPLPNTASLRPAMLVWSVGINHPRGPDRMVEVLSPAILGGHKTWRVTHYQDPTAASSNNYGLYDLDRETLVPLRSVWTSSGSYLEIAFDSKEAKIWTALDHQSGRERVPLANRVEAEGPGGTAFVAGLPLRPRFRTRYQIIDRWNGRGVSRLKRVTLSVSGRDAQGPEDVYHVQITPEDGSFQIQKDVLAAGEHLPIKLEYVPGKMHLLSELTRSLLQQLQIKGASTPA
jgi:hypothetical protein